MSATRIHALFNQKGGVGKTTCTVNLAAVVNKTFTNGPIKRNPETTDNPVLVANADPQGSAFWWAMRGEAAGDLPFDYVQLDDPSQLRLLRGRYRDIFVDTPGSLENGALAHAVLDESDDVVVPMKAEALSFDPTARTIREVLEPRGIPYRVVVNDWDPRDGHTDLIQTAEYIAKMGWPMCGNTIRHYKLHARAAASGMVCTQYPKNRVALEAQADFVALALELGYGGHYEANA